MSNQTDRFFVLSGGPGAGKTTLIEALRSSASPTTIEAGRAIIRISRSLAARPRTNRSGAVRRAHARLGDPSYRILR